MGIISFSNPQISELQLAFIIDVMLHQCALLVQREKDNQKNYPELYDEDYAKRRQTYDYTAGILAGFREDTHIPDMTVSKIQYGKGLWQPELRSATIVLQIYSNKVRLDAKEIKEKCKEFNQMNSGKKFMVLQFTLKSDGHLSKVDLVNFNSDAEEISRDTIYKYSGKVIPISA